MEDVSEEMRMTESGRLGATSLCRAANLNKFEKDLILVCPLNVIVQT